MCLLHHFAHPSVAHAYTVCSLPVQASNIFREFRQTPDLWRKYDADRSALWFDLETDMAETFGDDAELARAVERDARVRSSFEAYFVVDAAGLARQYLWYQVRCVNIPEKY
jgi:hypothetical protein